MRGGVFSRAQLALWIIVCCCSVSALASPEAGLPYLRHFTPSEIGGGPQALAVVQAPNGAIYFATNRSVLEYAGVGWRPYRASTPPRRLAVDANGRVWLGCDGDMGYLETSGRQLKFVSLREHLPEEDRPVRRSRGVVPLNGAVFFLYTNQLIRWSETTVHTWYAPAGAEFEAMTAWGNQIFVYQSGRGLLRWSAEASWPTSTDDGTVDSNAADRDSGYEISGQVQTILPLDREYTLLGTSDGRIHLWRDGEILPFSPEAERRINGNSVAELRSIESPDGETQVTVATRGGGFLLLGVDGSVLSHLTKETGLPGDEVYSVLQDQQRSLWLATSPGIVRLSSAPITFYSRSPSAPKSLLGATRYQGSLYLGGVEGAYRLQAAAGPEPARFVPIDGINGEVRAWAATPLGLLAGSNNGLFAIRDDRAERLAPEGQAVAWWEEKKVALVTDGHLLRILHPSASGWRLVDYPGLIPHRIYDIEPDGVDGCWLMAGGSRTFYRLSFPEGVAGAPRLVKFEALGPWPRPLRVDGRIAIRDGYQVFFWDGEGLREDTRFALAEWIPPGKDRYELRATASGQIWLTLRNSVHLVERDRTGNYQLSSDGLGLASDLNLDTITDPGEPNVLWLATNDGPARFEAKLDVIPSVQPIVRFHPPGPAPEKIRKDEDGRPVLDFSTAAVRFEVSLPYYRAEKLIEYRYRLRGLSDNWSEWTEEPVKEFTNLPGAFYTFEVDARHAERPIGQSSLTFRVLPPWHQTTLFRAFAVLGLVALALLYARFQRRKVKRERAINQRLREVDKLKDEFLANTSHELRTPLFGITGLAESLVDGAAGDVSDDVRKNLSMIAASGRRLGNLVNDLLDYSRIRHQKLDLECQPVDLHVLADVVLKLAVPFGGSKGLELRNNIPEDLPWAYADENRVEQILYNLIGNAVKFTAEGFVEVTAEEDGGFLVLSVRDSGIGISDEQQDSIFEAFEQGDTSIHREFGGTGLGLTVTRQLVELHGGKIWVDSKLGEGAIFFFTLPVADLACETEEPPSPRVAPKVESSMFPRSGAELEVPTIALPAGETVTARILAVDDEPVNLHVLRNYLIGTPGMELVTTTSGDDALELLRIQDFDLLLLDVMMPRTSGYEVCSVLRERYSMEDLPILFLTAKHQAADVVHSLSLQANDYLTKPIEREELLARIRLHLDLQRTHRRLSKLVDEKASRIKVLEGILPICTVCKKIEASGEWYQMESYINRHSEAEFSHGICPTCMSNYMDRQAP